MKMFKRAVLKNETEVKKQDTKGRKRKIIFNMRVTEDERDQINQRAALSGLLKQEFCIQSLMHQKVVCCGNIRLISEVKSQLCNIENHLIRLESADNFYADKLEQLRMISDDTFLKFLLLWGDLDDYIDLMDEVESNKKEMAEMTVDAE